MAERGTFITVEGVEGMGKSTVIACVADHYRSHGHEVVLTREPGGTEIAEVIREVILEHYDESMHPDTELLLYFASRAQHIHAVIIPALAAGKMVISDRFTDASYAYQAGGRGLDKDKIRLLEEKFASDIQPDVTLLLDAPVEVGLDRIRQRGEQDRMEKEQVEFFLRVQAAYHERAEQFPERFRIIDASQSIEAVKAASLSNLPKLS